MFLPGNYIKSLNHQDRYCNENFTVLCWNVAKLSLSGAYKEFLDSLIEDKKIDILLLQEVKKRVTNELDIYDYSYILSPNIQTKSHVFGVLSAFKISCDNVLSLLTKKKEMLYTTHKVTLITEHKISNEKKLIIVNLHAINFVKNSDFYNELQNIRSAVISHKGAMIVAGDFNTWNTKRVESLREFTSDLSLKQVTFSDNTNLKKVFSHSLDHIFYRGLELVDSHVINSKNISDHNPIVAEFKFLDF
ncbi:endonuclease/exonuclease/phosphatase family protein [Sulfurimonas sp. HSL-1716]|uniref:endonuclease/exonuclease/phosphatase family protein n=1 Tax=Hydrocurvibacter sulfurireducens TaxID=3131937 RepID=UPI0031F9D9C2